MFLYQCLQGEAGMPGFKGEMGEKGVRVSTIQFLSSSNDR